MTLALRGDVDAISSHAPRTAVSMDHTTVNRSPEEVVEIERHKYFLSEKAGHDVGWDFAERDWDDNHSAEFRRAHPEAKQPAAHGIGKFFDRIIGRRNPK